MKYLPVYIFLLALFTSCQPDIPGSDAYGNFEVTSTTISAEANGKLLFFNVREGQILDANTLIGIVDTTHLHLQKRQLYASLGTLPSKLQNTEADRLVLQDQKRNIVRERDRVIRLIEKQAATTKQLDDLNGQIDVIDQQIQALDARTSLSNKAILSERAPILAQIAVINEQIRKSYLYNPLRGTVITKLAEPYEMVGIGAPLYRIAPLDTLILRFYVDAVQLQSLALRKEVDVLVDHGEKGYRPLKGHVSWIADEAEFTPKTIQTKTDRVNLVYAVKATVVNPDGYLKIGMPAEVNFIPKPMVNDSIQ